MQTMNFIIDADLLLEAILNRPRFGNDAETVWESLPLEELQADLLELGRERIRYMVKQLTGNEEQTERVMSQLDERVAICPVDRALIDAARSFDLADFESALEVAWACRQQYGAIVTQQPQNFEGANLQILSVENLLERQFWEQRLKISKPIIIAGNRPESALVATDLQQPKSSKSAATVDNRLQLDLAAIDILNPKNTPACSILLSIQRWLVQFNLIGQYEAYEILSEAFLRGFNYCQTKGAIERPHPWLKRTAYNIIRELSRDQRRQVPMDPQLMSNFLTDETDESDQLAAQAESARQMQILSEVLDQVKREKSEDYQLLELLYFKGLSWAEIRQTLYGDKKDAPNEAALRQRLSRLRKQLRRLFYDALDLALPDGQN